MGLCLSLSGCAVDQGKEIQTYRNVIAMPSTGYTIGQPLALRTALLLANQSNENLASAGEDYLQSLISRRRTVAGFLPTLDLLGEYRNRDGSSTSSGNAGASSSQNRTFDLSANLDWQLFNGFRDLNRYWRDTFLIQRQHDQLLYTQESLLLDVVSVYYQVLRDEALVQVLTNSVLVQGERLRDARGRLAARVARPLDVAQTEAQLADTRTRLIDARRAVMDGRQLLALLTGAPVAEAPLVEAYELPNMVNDLEHYQRVAMDRRRDLSAADFAIQAARRDVEVAWGQYYPTVSLNLKGYLSRDTIPTDRDWEGLLAVNVPIFSAGRIHADVRAAWSIYRQAMLIHNYAARQVNQQVAQAYHDLRGSNDRLVELEVRLTAARQAFAQADASYQVGLATNLERVQAQDALLESQLQLTSEAYNRKVYYLSLLRSAGLLRDTFEVSSGTTPGAEHDMTTRVVSTPTTAPTDSFELREMKLDPRQEMPTVNAAPTNNGEFQDTRP